MPVNCDFSIIRVKKDEELSEYKDYDLVKLIQKDVDKYRNKCYWVCPSCGSKARYRTSLLVMGKFYVHEMKCQKEVPKGKGTKTKECKTKMNLLRDDGKILSSVYFDELFSRYQDKIVWESKKSHLIDHPDEVYSTLSSSFLKIVLQFDRKKNLNVKSDKWFSSFFWISVQNKIADLQKTNTYNKRCPTVRCMLCQKDIGQITIRHLYGAGHDDLFEEMFVRQGDRVLEESGEGSYYDMIDGGVEKERKRALHIGKRKFYRKKKGEQKKIFESECLSLYAKMFPKALFKNRVGSIDGKIKEDSDTELVEVSNDSVFGQSKDPSHDIEIESSMDVLSEIIIHNLDDELDKYLKKSFEKEKLKEIICEALMLKGSFMDDSENKKIDSIIKVVKRGFTEKLLEFTRLNRNCRMFNSADSEGYVAEKYKKKTKRRFTRVFEVKPKKDLAAV